MAQLALKMPSNLCVLPKRPGHGLARPLGDRLGCDIRDHWLRFLLLCRCGVRLGFQEILGFGRFLNFFRTIGREAETIAAQGAPNG